MKYFRQLLSFPFVVVGLPLFLIGMLIHSGLDVTNSFLEAIYNEATKLDKETN